MKTKENIFSRYLTEDEEKRLFKTVRQFADIYARRDAAWMQLLRHTGIRVGTLSGLTVADAKNAARDHSLTLRGEICKRGKGFYRALQHQGQKGAQGLARHPS